MRPFLPVAAILALAGALVPAGPARADSVPRYDVGAFCAGYAKIQEAVEACRRAEAQARYRLRVNWEVFPRQRRHFCVQSVRFRPWDQRSYVMLADCLDDQQNPTS